MLTHTNTLKLKRKYMKCTENQANFYIKITQCKQNSRICYSNPRETKKNVYWVFCTENQANFYKNNSGAPKF